MENINRVNTGDKDWWDELDEEQQKAIDRALEEAKAGKGIPHEEVMKQYKKWLKTGDNQDRPIFKEFGAFEAEEGSEE